MPHKDPAARKAYLQRWAEQNREKCREAQKRHYQKLKAAGKKRPWEARNPDKVRAMKREQARRKYKPSGRVVQTPEQRAEKARVAARDYRRRNREKVEASCKAWRSAHPEKAKAIRRRWETKAIAARRERSRLASQRKRARKAGAVGGVTKCDWRAIVQAYIGCCAYCGKSRQQLTMDHVVPLKLGGAHDVRNVVPACRRCNFSKGAKRLEDWAPAA
jgi:5-methylcytosine-specific restriction endonuclease McrA